MLAVVTALVAAAIADDLGAQQPPAEGGLEITECLVYSETDDAKRHDCTTKARELCKSIGRGNCELPIGLVLTGGNDIDGNRDTWEKVRVRFRCGRVERVNGPHHQNDHATMILACAGF